MIVCESMEKDFQVRFTDGVREAVSDTTPDHGGTGEGFNPHALLEASLGSCIAVVTRMSARKHGIPLEGVTVR
jgi:putative redox protein